jgi:hypothetical protein
MKQRQQTMPAGGMVAANKAVKRLFSKLAQIGVQGH